MLPVWNKPLFVIPHKPHETKSRIIYLPKTITLGGMLTSEVNDRAIQALPPASSKIPEVKTSYVRMNINAKQMTHSLVTTSRKSELLDLPSVASRSSTLLFLRSHLANATGKVFNHGQRDTELRRFQGQRSWSIRRSSKC